MGSSAISEDLSCTPKCVDPDPVPPEFEKDPDESWVARRHNACTASLQ